MDPAMYLFLFLELSDVRVLVMWEYDKKSLKIPKE
jgi:hypothetical protein